MSVYHFVYSSSGTRVRRSFLQFVWLSCAWIMWNERNNRLLKNKENNIHQLLVKVMLRSFWWMKATHVNFSLSFHIWLSNPFACLCID